MTKLYASMNVSEIGLLKSLLEEENIACIIRNEHVSILAGSVPFTDCLPELWLVKDEDFARASELLDRWKNAQSQEMEPWTCPDCGEQNEGQFGSCWKCGHMIDEKTNEADEPGASATG